jgi:hypothetical protein
MPLRLPFLLRKWYLDIVTDQGVAAIFYAARLNWGLVRTGYASALYAAPGEAPHEQATHRQIEWPREENDAITWHSRPLGVQGSWRRDAAPIERTLADDPAGSIQWTCHMPRARVIAHVGDACLEGLGYVESLCLTVPPWKLPFRILRWGRHASSRHSVVWIEWTGADQRRWVWLDGLLQPAAMLADAGLSGLEGGSALRLEPHRDLRDRPVLSTIGGPLPTLARRLAGPLGRMHERKHLARSVIVSNGRELDQGWTVHEEVTW